MPQKGYRLIGKGRWGYEITKLGRRQVGWRFQLSLQPVRTSYPEDAILSYLKRRKTPATSEEIQQGALRGHTLAYVLNTLRPLVKQRFVKQLRL